MCCFLLLVTIFEYSYSEEHTVYYIPEDQIDEQKILFGDPNKFVNPCCVDYIKVVSSTEYYKEAQDTDKGTAKYWILINKANKHALHLIKEVYIGNNCGLVVMCGYLESLTCPIKSKDVTEEILGHE